MDSMKGKLLLAFLVVAGMSLALGGCAKNTEVASSQDALTQSATEAEAVKQAEERKAVEAAARKQQEEEEAARERSAKGAEGLQPVHFDFDSANIREDAKSVLTANAEWLRSHPAEKVRIEGNCDERGTAEYNQALGQRRARNAKKYLTDLGVSPARVALLSYGKEKPACTESAEECWQKNRRDDFVVVE
jgi:peptidoglycan-associated lipoprotein